LVSDLQQKSASATVADLVKANWVLKQAQAMGRAGACLWFRPVLEKNAMPTILAVHDASFAQQPGHGSQSGYLVLRSTENVLKAARPEGVHLLDWASNKIHRVVRPTLAAEAASASHAHDRGTYVRVLLAELLSPGDMVHWTVQQREVLYGLGTDCCSLAEHCNKTGASVNEKRVSLDIADVRAAIDSGDTLRWMPTEEMPADGLTKHLPTHQQEPLRRICERNVFRFVFFT
jgi:hypothetical protein